MPLLVLLLLLGPVLLLLLPLVLRVHEPLVLLLCSARQWLTVCAVACLPRVFTGGAGLVV
jgi:hypothetical protein